MGARKLSAKDQNLHINGPAATGSFQAQPDEQCCRNPSLFGLRTHRKTTAEYHPCTAISAETGHRNADHLLHFSNA